MSFPGPCPSQLHGDPPVHIALRRGQADGIMIAGCRVPLFMYADDVLLLASTQSTLITMMAIASDFAPRNRFVLSPTATKEERHDMSLRQGYVATRVCSPELLQAYPGSACRSWSGPDPEVPHATGRGCACAEVPHAKGRGCTEAPAGDTGPPHE